MKNKIVSLAEIGKIAEDLRSKGKIVVTTNGAFDILHINHKRALEESKALGDVLIVGVNSDSSVKQYKSELRPIIGEAERAELLAGLASVDYVTIFNETDPGHFLDVVRPHIHTKGGDYVPEELVEYNLITRNGGKIVQTRKDQVPGISTTKIIERILDTYVPKA